MLLGDVQSAFGGEGMGENSNDLTIAAFRIPKWEETRLTWVAQHGGRGTHVDVGIIQSRKRASKVSQSKEGRKGGPPNAHPLVPTKNPTRAAQPNVIGRIGKKHRNLQRKRGSQTLFPESGGSFRIFITPGKKTSSERGEERITLRVLERCCSADT